MSISFPFRDESSVLFGAIKRPVARVFFHHREERIWQPVRMIVDTGADYTMLPQFLAGLLGVRLREHCRPIETVGVGGKSTVYFLRDHLNVRIGEYTRAIPVGFLPSDSIPPLLGRHEFLETFRVVFHQHQTVFDTP